MTAPGRSATSAARPSSNRGPGRTSASRNTSEAAPSSPRAGAQACGLPTHPAGSGRGGDDSSPRRRGRRPRCRRSSGRRRRRARRRDAAGRRAGRAGGPARRLVAGRHHDGDRWPRAAGGAGSGRVDHSSSQPRLQPAAYRAQPTAPMLPVAEATPPTHRRQYHPMMAERPRRQEQERAAAEVTEVAPGVLRAQLPIDMPGLGHVNCYVLEDARGFAIVDPGLPGRRPYAKLDRRLASAGVPMQAGPHRRRDPQPPRPLRRRRLGALRDRRRHRHPRALPADLGPRRAAGPRRRGRARPTRRDRRCGGDRGTRRRGAARATGSRSSGGCGCAPPASPPRLFKTPVPTRPPRRPPGHPRSPGASGWRCTRPATPRTTSACSTRPRA